MAGEIKETKNSSLFIAAIGASAGGLEALQFFFQNIKKEANMAYVVIQHLSPDYKSMMKELLARHTTTPIQVAEDGMLVKANNIYLIPPKKSLSIYHGKLFLDDQQSKGHLHLPIDIFFRSLASDLGSRAIGIVLSGTGSDGTSGVKAIKENGGMIIAQSPESCKFDGMPRSAIQTGLVDYVLEPQDIYEELSNYVKHPFTRDQESLSSVLEKDSDGLTRVMLILRDFSGTDFSHYKENTLVRRLERRVSVNRFSTLNEYIDFLRNSDEEKRILYRELLIGVTRFFRDENAFNYIEEKIIPGISCNKPREIRIWSVGCSTGEEVYSIAMMLAKHIEDKKLNCDFKIFATDIDKRAVETAGTGFYPTSIMGDVSNDLLDRYFKSHDQGWQINDEIRKRIIFATHNVLKDPPFSKIDLLICRNLFIYFKPESQRKTLNKFYHSLAPDGIMFLGSSESSGELEEAFETVNSKFKIFKKRPGFHLSIEPDVYNPERLTLSRERFTSSRSEQKVKQNYALEHILNEVLPPSLLIDSSLNILQLINDVNPYLSIKPGEFGRNVANMLDKELSLLINNLVRRLGDETKRVVFEDVKRQKFGPTRIDLVGRLIPSGGDEFYYLISFQQSLEIENKEEEEEVEIIDAATEKVKVSAQYQERLIDLEKELQFTRENLQATVEELETSNEELQASNEELIAANEELQSTNEELQSVNEELYTVNSEYQEKIEELTEINNDVNNLLNNTDVAAIYLDRKLCIRKFTRSFEQLSSIMNIDIGRPVEHLDPNIVYEGFISDLNKVHKDLQILEKEVEHENGNIYFVRLSPYRTDYQAVDGILATFVNISIIKKERAISDEYNSRLQSALEMGNMAWWEWDIPTGHVNYHEKKATMIGYAPDEFPNDVYEICSYIHPDDYEMTMQSMRDHLTGVSRHYDVVYRIKTKEGGYRYYYDKGGIVERDKDGKPLKLVGVVADITREKLQEKQLLSKESALVRQLDSVLSPAFVIDNSGVVRYINQAMLNKLNVPLNQVLEANMKDLNISLKNGKRSSNPASWKGKSQQITVALEEEQLAGIAVPVKDANHQIYLVTTV
jgi:two-component system CheB/CheR fusion protein